MAGLGSANRLHDSEEHDRADEGHDEAVEVEAGAAGLAEHAHDPASEHCTDDTDDDVEEEVAARLGDDRGKPAHDGTEYDPKDDTHV